MNFFYSAEESISLSALLPRLAHAAPPNASLEQQISLISVLTDFLDADKIYLGILRIASSLLSDESEDQIGGARSSFNSAIALSIALCRSQQGAKYHLDLIGAILLPALGLQTAARAPLHAELTECLRGIIWEHGAWHAAALILHRCSLLLPHPNEALGELSALLAKLEACVPTEEPPAHVRKAVGTLERLPLPAVCQLVASILQEPSASGAAAAETASGEAASPPYFRACLPGTVRVHGSTHSPGAEPTGHGTSTPETQQLRGARYVQALGLKLLLRRTLGMLGSKDESARKAAQRMLLPSCLQAAALVGGQLQQLTSSALWQTCRLMMVEPGKPHTDMVLSLMMQHASVLLPETQEVDGEEMHGRERALDVRTEEEFWTLVRHALASTEPVHNKRGIYLLKAALPTAAVREAPWSTFLSLHELLDEYPLHLIEGPWKEQIGTLHPPSAATAQQARSQRQGAAQAESPELDFDWASLLWRHGFTHPNPQVQRMVVHSFLERDWTPVRAALLPPVFVIESLLRTVTQPVMLLKGDGEALMQQTERLVSHYMASASSDTQRNFLEALIESQTVQSLPRATRKAIISCLAAAAEAAAPVDDTGWFAQVIARLRTVVSTFHFYGSPNLTADLCKGVVRTAAALGRPPNMPLSSVVPLLQELPEDAVSVGGSLHLPVRDWLLGSGEETHAAWYLDGLKLALEEFFTDPTTSNEAQSAITAEELAAWTSAAQRWARLMMIGAHAEGALKERLLQALEDQTQELYRRPYLRRGTADRTLILLNALFEVGAVNTGSAEPGSEAWLPGRLASLAEVVAEELSAYAAASLQFFWTPVESPRAASSQGMAPFQWSSAASSNLPAEVQASVARAKLAIRCTQLATLCMLRSAAPTGTLTEAAARAADLLQRAALKFVQCFALTPLPLPGGRRMSEDGRLPKHIIDSYMQLHAHALGCMAEACSGLAATGGALQSLGRAFTGTLNLEAVMQALLRHPLAAVTPEAAAERFGAETETERWRAVEGVLCLASRLPAGSRAFAGTTRVRILAETLQALDASHDDTLVTLLHCLRLALADVIGTPVLMPAADAALGLQSAAGATEGNLLLAVVGAAARGAWAAVQECQHNARRPAVVTALLDAVLQPSLFDCWAESTAYRLAVHEEGGPLYRFLDALFKASAKSPQTMAIAAVHLCGLWVEHPAIALLYLGFWERLLLYGNAESAALKGSDLSSEAEFFQEPGNLCIDPDVQEAYMGTEMAARVTSVVAAHQLASQPPPQPQSWFGSSSASEITGAERVGQALWRRLLGRAAPGGDLGQPGHYVTGSTVHRSRVRAWQALAVLSKFAPADDVKNTFRTIWSSLQVDNIPSVRQYQEAILVGLLLRHPELVEEYLLPVLAAYEHRWEGLASAVLMSAQVVLHAPKAVRDRLLQPVLTTLFPWTLHHHHSLRTFAQLVVQELLERFPEATGTAQNLQLAAVARFLGVNADLRRLRRSIGACIAAYDPATASSPRGVFCVGVQMVGKPEDGPGIEGAPLALLERVTAFLAQERAKLRTELNAANTGLQDSESLAVSDRQRKANPAGKKDDSARSLTIERSLTVADAVLGEHSASGGPGADAGGSERQGIIVVASLLDKAPNLAGLARTCEVFQAAALVMADLRVLKDAAFVGVAMTAQQWVPLLQVAPRDLLPWLSNKRAQGYRVIGLEQTVESQALPHFEFPERSVLVLGKEGTGIPANLLQAVDCCVEIPQLGLIRSLNVHVSGALAVYEYTRQQQRWKAAPAAVS